MQASIERIVIVGAGNLATNLGEALRRKCRKVEQVFSRTAESAAALAERLGCGYTTSLEDIVPDADLYVVSVKDGAVGEVVRKVAERAGKGIVVHTAGSIPMSVFGETQTRHGVFYPMQTFSKQKMVDFNELSIFVEASDEDTLVSIENFAHVLTDNVYRLNSEQRRYLHLAAVFACNFANHCFTLADDVLRSQGLPFSVMMPLIRETVDKLEVLAPRDAQTGPAARGDLNVIEAQRQLISNELSLRVYDTMTDGILHYNSYTNHSSKDD